MLMRHDLQSSSTKRRSLQKRHRSNKRLRKDTQRITKKHKLDHPSRRPPRFWDNLSQLELTKGALGELDRRNATEHPPHLHHEHQHRRPRTRRAAAARRNPRPSALEFLQQSSPTDRAQLRRFARHGGPNLRDLRGYRQPIEPEMSSSQSSLGRRKRGSRSSSKTNTTPNTTTTRSTGPYDRAFQQHLIDHNIFPPGYEYPNGDELPEPENMDEIRRELEKPRASLSPSRFSKDDFKRFRRADDHATKESRVTASVIPIIEGDPGDRRCVASDVQFSNLEHLTDGSLVCAKPDLYYGARPEQLHRAAREDLSNLIVPSPQEDLPVVPNNFVEVKGPDGSSSVVTRQALYDVALGSRGLHALQAHGDAEPSYDNNANALAWTYHGGHLKAYASHLIEPSTPGAQPGYVVTQIKGWSLTSDLETFRQGATAFRNGRDWTKQRRDEIIAQANEKVCGLRVPKKAGKTPHPSTIEDSHDPKEDPSLTLLYDSDTSADELLLEAIRMTSGSNQSSLESFLFAKNSMIQIASAGFNYAAEIN